MTIPSFARIKRMSAPCRSSRTPLLLVLALATSGLPGQADPPAKRTTSPVKSPKQEANSPSSAASFEGVPQRLLLGLSVVPGPGQSLVTSDRIVYDFGRISLLERQQIEQTFVLLNETQAPMDDMRVTLGQPAHTQVFVSQFNEAHQAPDRLDPTHSLPILQPGRMMKIYVVVTLAEMSPGRIRVPITLYRRGFRQSTAILEVDGALLPAIRFSPNLIEFGNGPAGKKRSVMLHIAFDPEIAPPGSSPRIYCANPDVKVEVGPTERQAIRGLPAGRERPEEIYSYKLTLSENAPLGPITGQVSVVSVAPPLGGFPRRRKPSPQSAIDSILRNTSGTLTGLVKGSMEARPSFTAMGLVVHGQETRRRIVLAGTGEKAFEGLMISSASPLLLARLIASDIRPATSGVSSQSSERLLDIILAAEAPVGMFQSQMVLTLANGQRLVIPVTAKILPPSAPTP